jgi:cell division protein FtsB
MKAKEYIDALEKENQELKNERRALEPKVETVNSIEWRANWS